ncbi:MAG: right-handed parallel beta-helix repeat-containing protein [bacterium]|nr:right-handed parallel beta-helix repeat-containing protein [bacterium]
MRTHAKSRRSFRAVPAVILALLAAWESGNAFAGTVYCSPEGSDMGSGTRDRPFRSPGAASRLLSPGDTLILLAGTYVLSEFDADILAPQDGRPGAWITIRGQSPDRPVLAGRNDLLCAVFLSSYLRLESLEITSSGGAFFRDGLNGTDRPLRNVILSGLNVHHLDGMGLNIRDVDSLTVENCDFSHCGFGGIGGPEGEAGGLRHVRISGCSLSYSGRYYRGIMDNPDNPYDRPDGFGIEPSDGPVEIIRTLAEHNRGDGLDSKAANTAVRQCRVENNFANGVKLWAGGSRIENTLIAGTGDGDPSSPWANIVIESAHRSAGGFEIVHCTVADNPGRRSYSMHVQYDTPLQPVAVTVRNSIFSGAYGSVFFGDSVRLTCEYNLFDRGGGDVQIEARGQSYTSSDIQNGLVGPGNRTGDPLFVRPAWGTSGDYRLQEGSPAINAGMIVSIAADLDDGFRPQGGGFDMGCYESAWAAAVRRAPSRPSSAGTVFPYPNPSNGSFRVPVILSVPCEPALELFDAGGRRVRTITFGRKVAGVHILDVSAGGLPSGVYLGRLAAGGRSESFKWTHQK